MHCTPTAELHFQTPAGLRVQRTAQPIDGPSAIEHLTTALGQVPGVLLASDYERPDRYHRNELGFIHPPFGLQLHENVLTLNALHPRGLPLLDVAEQALRNCEPLEVQERHGNHFTVELPLSTEPFFEEERTRRPAIAVALRALVTSFHSPDDGLLGLYGAFGYDLVFHFESLQQRQRRDPQHRPLVLYIPDRLVHVDHARGTAFEYSYEYSFGARSSRGLAPPPQPGPAPLPLRDSPGQVTGNLIECDHAPGEFEALVRRAKQSFQAGEMFEVTPSQRYSAHCQADPSTLYRSLRQANPVPFGFFIHLQPGEFLLGASPEMYVRVRGREVETCPIAGTIARGQDALEDAEQIRTLLSSAKDEAEITMCTDVDRNDKARICEPGSIQVLGRRQIELYSRLIHTVDHVVGRLRPDRDAIDALLTHCWAVTVTGAPKLAAMQFIEDHEHSPREYYGGAVGALLFNGDLNTGLVIRTIHIKQGLAQVRAGATLLHASDPATERGECELKASAMLATLTTPPSGMAGPSATGEASRKQKYRRAPRLLLIDHQDSFVHMLADYCRQAGASVVTLRAGFEPSRLLEAAPDLVVLSPGPGRPEDFGMEQLLQSLAATQLPVFGVCLGLQGMIECCGGHLDTLPTPRHGHRSRLAVEQPNHPLFAELGTKPSVGRYHSLYGRDGSFPGSLEVLARAEDDGCVMALAHRTLPWLAVQFHPESLMSAQRRQGQLLVRNAIQHLC